MDVAELCGLWSGRVSGFGAYWGGYGGGTEDRSPTADRERGVLWAHCLHELRGPQIGMRGQAYGATPDEATP